MLGTRNCSEALTSHGQGSMEPASFIYDCQDQMGLDGHQGSFPLTGLCKGGSGISSSSENDTFSPMVQEADVMRQAFCISTPPASFPDGDESVPPTELRKGVSGNSNCSTEEMYDFEGPEDVDESLPPTELHKGLSGNSNCSTEEMYEFDVPKEQSTDGSESWDGMDVDCCVAAAPQFPGFEETSFSLPGKRYYKKNGQRGRGDGNYGVVEQVYWYNPGTGELELFMAKSPKVDVAVMDPDLMSHWQAQTLREIKALCHVAGVPGVVRYRDFIPGPSGIIHIILEKVRGVSMETRLTFRSWDVLGLTWLQLRLALYQLAQVLADCHRLGLVHGDVKLENLMSLKDKDGIVLVDFGSASIWDGAGWEYEGGTLLYTAPELLRYARSKSGGDDASQCSRAFGPAVDCWSYGLTALKLLTKCSLFNTGPCPDEISGPDAVHEWRVRATADLHADWEDPSESRPVHATFREETQQLAGASEEFRREGVDFLRALLHPDPVKRLTAEKALQHPFLLNAFLSVAPESMPPKVERKVKRDPELSQAINNFCHKAMQEYGLEV